MATETCCLCCERRAGVIILGTLSLLFNILITVSEWQTSRDWERIAINVLFGTAAILLLIGVVKERYRLFTPYLIIQGVGVLVTILVVVVFIIIQLTNHYEFLWGGLIVLLIILGFQTYFFYVVYNFQKDISAELPR